LDRADRAERKEPGAEPREANAVVSNVDSRRNDRRYDRQAKRDRRERTDIHEGTRGGEEDDAGERNDCPTQIFARS